MELKDIVKSIIEIAGVIISAVGIFKREDSKENSGNSCSAEVIKESEIRQVNQTGGNNSIIIAGDNNTVQTNYITQNDKKSSSFPILRPEEIVVILLGIAMLLCVIGDFLEPRIDEIMILFMGTTIVQGVSIATKGYGRLKEINKWLRRVVVISPIGMIIITEMMGTLKEKDVIVYDVFNGMIPYYGFLFLWTLTVATFVVQQISWVVAILHRGNFKFMKKRNVGSNSLPITKKLAVTSICCELVLIVVYIIFYYLI